MAQREIVKVEQKKNKKMTKGETVGGKGRKMEVRNR